ncbi:type II toxin-antitoxin system VapC family toxin [Olivibacter sp. CPCC 100613]|uniref:type II toxin-antitoxin system VapC family toxin n=1 Tax=Olivibacter sp. CPCC 100613 TaxID=3079931 RepID=UPI002FFC703E
MGKKFLLDTNAIIDFCSSLLPAKGQKLIAKIVDDEPIISVINKIELSSLNDIPPPILAFLDLADIIPLDNDIVNQTILLRKKYKLKLPDAVIAASALINDYTIVTHNVKDFNNIKGLKILDPHN